jgi:3-hydroxyisobutyrate dehydrogenase-like beta-hydroxyacid dehydrogenase
MNVGFIGLGHMGKAIATNLLRAGHQLSVWNRSSGPAAELVSLGATLLTDPAAAARTDVLFTMLADDGAHRAVLLDQAVLGRATRGLIHVNLATISVALARELAAAAAAHGVRYVAAPVFGRPEVAQAGKLNIVAAGDCESLARIEPLLAAIGQKTWRVPGPPESANAVKLAGNFMIASAIEAMGEAAALSEAHGVGARQFLEILTQTLFASPVYQVYGGLIAERRYAPAGFKLRLGLKDVRLALEAGEEKNVALPLGSLLRDHFIEALAGGQAEQDWSAIAELSRRRAALP